MKINKLSILGISNREEAFILTIPKISSYTTFFYNIFLFFNETAPELQDQTGKDIDIMKEIDSCTTFKRDNIYFIESVGKNKIFLIFLKVDRVKLKEFLDEYTEFIKYPNKLDEK